MSDGLYFYAAVLACVWLLYLWINEPRYLEGKYVSVRTRLRKIIKRLIPCRNKQRADDP